MKVAIVGWGSLIWSPAPLPHDGTWRPRGPALPVEFSRVSPDGRLTLVIDSVHGAEVSARWSLSTRRSVEEAVVDLAEREVCKLDGIGYLVGSTGENSRSRYPGQHDVISTMSAWSTGAGVDGVVWTALPATFEARTGRPFSVNNALDYLDSLTGELRETALRYLRNAPDLIDTPVRRAFDADARLV